MNPVRLIAPEDICCFSDGSLRSAAALSSRKGFDPLAVVSSIATAPIYQAQTPKDITVAINNAIDRAEAFASRYLSANKKWDSLALKAELTKKLLKEIPEADAENPDLLKLMNQFFWSKPHAEKIITQAFVQLPEWLQVITHDRGAHTFVYDADTEAAGMSWDHLTDRPVKHPFSIALARGLLINPERSGSSKQKNQVKQVLQEELLHSLYAVTNNELFYKHQECSLGEKWYLAAADEMMDGNFAALLKKSDPRVKHALEIIRQTEPKGNSSLLDTDEHADAELLVDIFDAEIYLCKHKKYSPKEAQTKLHEVFSYDLLDQEEGSSSYGKTTRHDLFALSREYVELWIEKAAGIIEAQAGKDVAERYKQKWLADPFCHTIEIVKDPILKSTYDVAAATIRRH